MRYYTVYFEGKEIARIPLDETLTGDNALVLARGLSRDLGVIEPSERTPAHHHLLAVVAELTQRVNSLERRM